MKKIILAAAVMAVAAMAVASFASAGVQRTQVYTGLTMTVNGTYVHTYAIDMSCDGSFTGTGGVAGIPNLTEAVSGTIVGSDVTSIQGTYSGTYNPGYTWSDIGGVITTSMNQSGLTATFQLTGLTDAKNHGDWVSQNANKNDAAHSCVGMPVQA